MTVEDACRAQWTTHDNLNQWFDDVKADLLSTDMTRRVINMDETHHDLSITGDKGGSPSVSYYNSNLQQGANNKGVKSARHVASAYYAMTAAGQALPLVYIFVSSAKSKDNFRVSKVEWLVRLYLFAVAGMGVLLSRISVTACLLCNLAARWTIHF